MSDTTRETIDDEALRRIATGWASVARDLARELLRIRADARARIIIESPYAGDVERHLRYLRACLADSLWRGEAPFASHGLYTQPGVLDDSDAAQRILGINAGFRWRAAAGATAVYHDLGVSEGMRTGIAHALDAGHVVVYRLLGGEW